MNKSTMILVAVLALVAAIGWLWFSGSNVLTETTPVVMEEEVTAPLIPDDVRRGVATMEELSQLGEDQECAVSYDDETTQESVKGTYFVSEGKIRGDFETPSPDLSGSILSSVIIKDATLYSWSEIEGQSYGVKINLSDSSSTQPVNNGPVTLKTVVKYECKPWPNVDRSVFAPPADVIFRDQSELIKAGMEEAMLYETNSSSIVVE